MEENLSATSDFVLDQNEKTSEIAEAGLAWNKDPFLRIKRDARVPTIQLRQAEARDKEEEKENVPPS